MDRWISHFSEPSRLLLAWRGTRSKRRTHALRCRQAIAQRKRCHAALSERARGRKAQEARVSGISSLQVRSARTSARRACGLSSPIAATSPAGFDAYKAQFRLKPDLGLTDFALLAYTGARLPSDGFSVVDKLEDVRAPSELVLEIVGHRHWVTKLKSPLHIGEALDLLPEPENPVDKNAVVMKARGNVVGYVNRLQTAAFQKWLREGSVEATLDR